MGVQKYRVIKRPAGQYDVPVAAVQLAEDLVRLERIIGDLKAIDPCNVSDSQTQDERDFCCSMIQSQIVLVYSWHRYAKRKLLEEFLANH